MKNRKFCDTFILRIQIVPHSNSISITPITTDINPTTLDKYIIRRCGLYFVGHYNEVHKCSPHEVVVSVPV